MVLCGRWDIMYRSYCIENNLRVDQISLQKYTDAVILDLNEQISLHPNLKFYIVGCSFVPNKTAVIWSKVNLNESYLKKIINTDLFKSTSDFEETYTTGINTKLIEFCKNKNNVIFIDRNAPLKEINSKYRIYRNNKGIFEDQIGRAHV